MNLLHISFHLKVVIPQRRWIILPRMKFVKFWISFLWHVAADLEKNNLRQAKNCALASHKQKIIGLLPKNYIFTRLLMLLNWCYWTLNTSGMHDADKKMLKTTKLVFETLLLLDWNKTINGSHTTNHVKAHNWQNNDAIIFVMDSFFLDWHVLPFL